MSILSNITETTPIAVQRSTRNFARGVFRVINNFVAAIIAERERQANLAILRNLSELGARSVLVWLRRPRSEHSFRGRWRSVVPSSGKGVWLLSQSKLTVSSQFLSQRSNAF